MGDNSGVRCAYLVAFAVHLQALGASTVTALGGVLECLQPTPAVRDSSFDTHSSVIIRHTHTHTHAHTSP
jgi:hypothetical protein